MQTAIQELIEHFKNNHPFYIYTKDDIIKLLGFYLEKEKQSIIDTYWDAYKEGQISSDVTADEYYIQNYKNNE